MLSLNTQQQTLVDADYKQVAWLFDIKVGSTTYYWSTIRTKKSSHPYEGVRWNRRAVEWDSEIEWAGQFSAHQTYRPRIIPESFAGISISRAKAELGIQATEDLLFSAVNPNSLTADDFVDAEVLVTLLLGDGNNPYEVITNWKFRVKSCYALNQTLNFDCEDFIRKYFEGDYPNTKLIRDLSPSDDPALDDTLCAPVSFGTCFVPIRSIYITDQRYYVLGESAGVTHTISKVRSPRSRGNSVWLSSEYDFEQSRKVIDSVGWRVFQPIIQDVDNDGVADYNGLWKDGDYFLDALVEFYANTTRLTKNPASAIEFILKDYGIDEDYLDVFPGGTFPAQADIYASRNLEFEGAFFHKTSREAILAILMLMCHSTLISKEKIQLKALSKTSQKTITSANIFENTFSYSLFSPDSSNYGHVSYPPSGEPEDVVLKYAVPVKSTSDIDSGIAFTFPFIRNSQHAQIAASLALQRRLLPNSNLSFLGRSNLITLEPDDVITINGTNYGGSYDVLIDSMLIKRDLSIEFNCIGFSEDLDDWEDLSFSSISVATDDSPQPWQQLIYGPSAQTSSGDIPNQSAGGFYFGTNDIWGGSELLSSASTVFIIGGNNDDDLKLAFGTTADAITFAGTQPGFYVDGQGRMRIGDSVSAIKLTPGSGIEASIKNISKKLLVVSGDYLQTLLFSSTLTANRTMTVILGDAARTITLTGNPTLANWFDQAVKIASSPTFKNAILSALTANTLLKANGSKQLTSIADGSANDVISTDGSGAYTWKNKRELGLIYADSSTYVSGTGTAGTANTAQTVITRTLPANTLTQVGDRLRVRLWFYANSGAGIVATTKIGPAASEVNVGDVTHTGGASFNLIESWMHYIDNTHCNITEQESGGTIGGVSAINVAGFTWDAAQNIIITQDAVSGNFITVFGIFVDVFPLGV